MALDKMVGEKIAGKRPVNILWVFGDQHRGCSMGYAGDPNLSTPSLDRLAHEGTVFTQAVGGTPLCCPFRGSLLSGRYPHHCVPGHEDPFPDGMPTVAYPFKEAGYETVYFGKWHVDGFKESRGRAAYHKVPAQRRGGFDSWVGFENNNSQFDCWVHGHDLRGDEVPHYRLPGYETDALTDLLLQYLNGRQQGVEQKPFFGVLSVQPPHDPFIAPREFMEHHSPGKVELRRNVPPIKWVEEKARRNLAGYHAMIENLDWNFGRIRQVLEKQGEWENTVIFFFSDHGDMQGSHGRFAKTTPYHESLNVPCVVGGGGAFYDSEPHYIRPQQTPFPINHVDYGPTSLGLCGLEVPAWMQGTDLSELLYGKKGLDAYPSEAYLSLPRATGHGNSAAEPWRGIMTTDGEKYACIPGQPWLHFDHREDPYEFHNMALNPSFKKQRKALHERLVAWVERTGDTFDLPSC